MNNSEPSTPSLPIDPTTFALRLQHRPTNHVEGYDHGAQAKRYLRLCAERSGLYLEEPERDEPTLAAMQAARYASWDKFARHLQEWHRLNRPMPCTYASFIGVRQPALLAAVDEDRQDHARALTSAPVLCSWTLRRMAGVYEVRPFLADCQNEAACIEYVRSACVHHGLRACIHVRGVKTHWVEPPDGHLLLTVYTPQVKFTRAWIVFADDGRNEGTMQAR